jgi:hypothetical protein
MVRSITASQTVTPGGPKLDTGEVSVVGGPPPAPVPPLAPDVAVGAAVAAGSPPPTSTAARQPAPEVATMVVWPLSDASGAKLISNAPAASLWVVNVSGDLPSMVIEMSTAALAGKPEALIVNMAPIATEAGAVSVHVAAAAGPTATASIPLEMAIEVTSARIRLPCIDAVPPSQAVRRSHAPDDDRARPTTA